MLIQAGANKVLQATFDPLAPLLSQRHASPQTRLNTGVRPHTVRTAFACDGV